MSGEYAKPNGGRLILSRYRVPALGHSARRISDFWAGLNRDWSETQGWKRFRRTAHDHNPVNDAMGNVEAFDEILRMAQTSQPRQE